MQQIGKKSDQLSAGGYFAQRKDSHSIKSEQSSSLQVLADRLKLWE